jgi:hypothetical protein
MRTLSSLALDNFGLSGAENAGAWVQISRLKATGRGGGHHKFSSRVQSIYRTYTLS